MTKQEAIISIEQGNVLRHLSFAPDNSIKLSNKTHYKYKTDKLIDAFDEKVICIGSHFFINFDKYWSFKDHISYNEGWSLV